MKILVTGGAGFIGSHIVRGPGDARGTRVRVLDNFFSGKRENLRAVSADVEVLTGDCADPAAARRARKGIEAVFHEGAIPSVARSVKDPALSHQANATATLTMLVAARDARVRRFIYAGSSSVYGDTPTLPKHERMTPMPLSPYAVGEAGRGALPPGLRSSLRPRDPHDSLLQRLRPAAGPRLPVQRSDQPLHDGASRGQDAGDLR